MTRNNKLSFFILLSLCVLSMNFLRAADLQKLFDERRNSLVVVEFFIQHEIDRQATSTLGVVFDAEGRIMLLDNAVPSWLPPERFKEFKVRVLGEDSDGHDAEYLGHDYLTGYHYIQVEEAAWSLFTPVTTFGQERPKIGENLWGIGIMSKNWDYKPYLLSGRLSMIHALPGEVGFTNTALGSPGSPVFNEAGTFVGWIGGSASKDYSLIMSGERYNVALQPLRESTVFLLAEPFYKYLERIPSKPVGDPRPWIGVSGLQPIDREVAQFLELEDQGALVISDVIEDSPAAIAGFEGKDIVVELNGEPLPKYRPDFVVSRYFERWVMEQGVDREVAMTVIRGKERKELQIKIAYQPTPLNQAGREYFEDLGVAVREFTLYDGVSRRILKTTSDGVIAEFVKPNSSVNAADLQSGDWVKEIDGEKVDTYDKAVELLKAIEVDESRKDFVMLISRNNETKVLRVKLN